jgi:hypothetical protein
LNLFSKFDSFICPDTFEDFVLGVEKKKKKKEKFPNNQKNLILLKNRNIPQIGPPSGHFGPLHRNTGFNLVIQLFC